MPVSDEHALQQFQIEALRQITDNLTRLNRHSDEQTKTLHSIDVRLTKIETNSVSSDVVDLKQRVDDLERDEDRRAGALNLATWLLRYGPVLAGIIALIFVVLKANGKL